MSITPMFPGPFISSGVISGGGGGGGNVTPVHNLTGTNGLCSGSSTCNYAFPNSPTSGNTLVIAADVNHGAATLSITGLTGSGCPSSFTLATNVSNSDNAIAMYAWTGTAAGTGSCTVTLSAGGFFSNWDVQGGEFTGGSGVVDSYGSAANNASTTLAITANSATTATNDYGVVFWAANGLSNFASATGWTSEWNSNYVGGFGQGSIANGTTVSFSGSVIGGAGAENIGIMLILK